MLELSVIFLTIGAMLYRVFHVGVVGVGGIGLVVAIIFLIVFRSRQGIVFGLVMGGMLVLGSLALWRVDVPLDQGVFGKRAFDAHVISVNRQLDKTSFVIVDKEFDQRLQGSVTQDIDILPGDNITVRGEVEPPEDFMTNTGRIFGYQAYLGSKGIVGLVNNAIVGPVMSRSFALSRIPTILRYTFADIFATYVSFPFDGVIAGMVVGYQGGLPDYISDLFRNTGVLHVLVLSGYNITLLAGFLAILLKGLPFRARNFVTIIAIVMLVLISGAGVASVRAGIMGGIAVMAGLSLRTYQPMRALWISYLFFFFMSPTSIFVDPGFHLSFLATMFMILVLPKVETLFHWLPQTRGIDMRELIMLAVSAPIFMLPYMMYFSGNFPLSSPFANILFAIITPLIMISGIILIALSWITPVATLFGTLVSWFGNLVLKILELCDHIYIWQTPAVPWWGVTGVYVVMLYFLFRRDLTYFWSQLYIRLRQTPSSYLQKSPLYIASCLTVDSQQQTNVPTYPVQ